MLRFPRFNAAASLKPVLGQQVLTTMLRGFRGLMPRPH